MIRAFIHRLTGAHAVRAWAQQRLSQLGMQHDDASRAATKRLNKLAARADESHAHISAVAERVKPLRGIPAQVESIESRLGRLERVIENSTRLAPELLTTSIPNRDDIAAHARTAIGAASLDTDPAPHVVIDRLLPKDSYAALLASLPPADCFQFRNDFMQEFYFDAPGVVPPLSPLYWMTFERDVVQPILMPALLDLFAPVLRAYYADLFGEALADEAMALPKAANGRVLLRRPGYKQNPHIDPKRAVLTGLLYLAQPDESSPYGTALYTLDRPIVQPDLSTFYPETAGYRCTLAKRVEYRPNRLFVFLNGVNAAHGAELPADAPLPERYAYQFYVKTRGLASIVKRLPPDRQALWEGLPGMNK